MSEDQATSPSDDPCRDPTVEEVREIRRRLWADAGRDLAEYIRRAHDAAERIRREDAA